MRPLQHATGSGPLRPPLCTRARAVQLLAGSAVAVGAATAAPGPAWGAPGAQAQRSRGGPPVPAYSARMAAALEYLDAHPLQLGSAPMYYEPDSQLAQQLPGEFVGLTPDSVLPPGCDAVQRTPGVDHFACTTVALLYLAAGALDHAHNLLVLLITHTTWAEGACDGEFGPGFSNANYWYAAAGAAGHPISGEVLAEAQRLARGNVRLEQLVASHGDAFSPPRFVASCSKALESRDAELSSFWSAVGTAEWLLLLRHCFARLQAECSAKP
ncbi:hypothetical protein FOA52_005748 [Chlamydomonas sp. UWO 241]|nr:hypothetical protein FOA52_005748 [Chlamydomonas sp. UWO 241]